MAQAAVTLAARGTMRSTTFQALPIEELIESLKVRLARAHIHHMCVLLLARLRRRRTATGSTEPSERRRTR